MAEETVRLDMPAMLEWFKSLGTLMAPAAYVAMLVTGQKMVRDVVTQRLAGPRGAPGILGIVTGNARRSMVGPATMSKDLVTAALGSPVEYVKAHEEGFHGAAHVRAHERRRLGEIRAVSIAKATRGKVTRRSAPTAAQRRAGPIRVRAFDRKVNILAKHFIRDTVLAQTVPATDRVVRALMIAAKTGRIPSPGQLNLG